MDHVEHKTQPIKLSLENVGAECLAGLVGGVCDSCPGPYVRATHWVGRLTLKYNEGKKRRKEGSEGKRKREGEREKERKKEKVSRT